MQWRLHPGDSGIVIDLASHDPICTATPINARLIASAPDLLAALTAALDDADDWRAQARDVIRSI
jgi:hypothetical protein